MVILYLSFTLLKSLFLYIGKETHNATLSHGVVMCQAIKTYHKKSGYQVYIFYFNNVCIELLLSVNMIFSFIIFFLINRLVLKLLEELNLTSKQLVGLCW